MKTYLGLLFCVFFVFSCSTVSTSQKSNETPETPVVQKVVKGPFDGTYQFDIETYKQVQLQHSESQFKDKKPDEIDRMLKIYKPFKIQLQGDKAVATFSNNEILGTLKKISETSSEAEYFMTPLDEDNKDETVTLIIQGSNMILDPGKTEIERMYFSKVGD